MANYTPMVQQYLDVKNQHPNELLFFRLGDFYEMFFEDAVTASRELNITLTKRQENMPMCGVPYHSVDGYIAKLVKKGYRIAICEQVQDPKEAKGIVERKVIKIKENILFANFERRVGTTPKEINKEKLLAYFEKYKCLLEDGELEELEPLVNKYLKN